MTKRYQLTEPAFIGGALLAEGSRITDDDLPVGPDPRNPGKTMRSPPPETAIEIDANGVAVNKADRVIQETIGAAQPIQVAPIQPHAPNPTAPQALPGHGVASPLPVGEYVPAEGVESNEAAAARAEQLADATDAAPASRRRKPAN